MSGPTLAQLRDEFRVDAARRALDMARDGTDSLAAFDGIEDGHPQEAEFRAYFRDRALTYFAGAQAWAAVAALLGFNGEKG